jgi:hypothetical protein
MRIRKRAKADDIKKSAASVPKIRNECVPEQFNAKFPPSGNQEHARDQKNSK